jgi:nicotinamidase-related amidase
MFQDAALLIIDMQVGAFQAPDPVFDGLGLLQRVHILIGRARVAGIPIIYVQHEEPPGGRFAAHSPLWAIHPVIAPSADDLIIPKTTLDAFTNTALDGALQTRRIATLLLTGIVTEHSYSATCQEAAHRGYQVTVVTDGHTTYGTSFLPATEIIAAYNTYVFAPVAKLQATDELRFI